MDSDGRWCTARPIHMRTSTSRLIKLLLNKNANRLDKITYRSNGSVFVGKFRVDSADQAKRLIEG